MTNGVVVGRDNRQSYRNLFSNVFSDFHLNRLYGINEIDHDRVRGLLELTDLLHKTSIVDRQITFLSLSSGERKRLALVVSLLEDKPILLLDEWAAEQDRPFRRKFYREILPWLKQQQKKTVVAITHDDDYWENLRRSPLAYSSGTSIPTFSILGSRSRRPVQLCRTALGLRTLGIAAHQTAPTGAIHLERYDSESLGFWAGATLNYLRRFVGATVKAGKKR